MLLFADKVHTRLSLRLYLISKCKSLKILDFKKVKLQVGPEDCDSGA